jgi:hypothetical protein
MQWRRRLHLLAVQVKKVRKTPMRFGRGHQLIAHSIGLLLISTTDSHLTIGVFLAWVEA